MISAATSSHQSVQSFEVDSEIPAHLALQLNAPSEDVDPIFLTPRAHELFKAGERAGVNMRPKAFATDKCQELGATFFCDNGHARQFVRSVCYRCRRRFSDCGCAEYNLNLEIRDRKPLIDQISALDLHHQYQMVKVTIKALGEFTPEGRVKFMRKFRAVFNDTLTPIMECDASSMGIGEHAVNGYTSGRYVGTGFILTNEVAPYVELVPEFRLSIRAHFGTDVIVSTEFVRSPHEVAMTFREMYTKIIPESVKRQAELEVLFHAIPLYDQVEHNNVSFLLQPPKDNRNEEGLTLERANFEPTSGDKSTGSVGCTCSICHGKPTMMTRPHPMNATMAEIFALKVTRLTPKAPPGPPN